MEKCHPATKQKVVSQAIAISLKIREKPHPDPRPQKVTSSCSITNNGPVNQAVVDRYPEIRV